MVDDMRHVSFSVDDIEEVLALIADKKWPGPNMSAEKCYLWTMIRLKLGIKY